MSDTPDSLHFEEYRALRSTIRERGSLRVIVIVITFSAWAGALLAASALFTIPLFSLVPLTVLAAGFETVFALHVAVERIGRYIHAHYEPLSATTAGWEHADDGVRGLVGRSQSTLPCGVHRGDARQSRLGLSHLR